MRSRKSANTSSINTRVKLVEPGHHREVLSKLMKGLIARGVSRGEFRKGALTDLPEVLVGPGIMAAIWQMTFASEEDIPLERFLAAHLDLIERCLRK